MRNPLSLEAFADWLETKPADETYNFNCLNCAIGQYFKFLGMRFNGLGTENWTDDQGVAHYLPRGMNRAAQGDSYYGGHPDHTFGKAAQRARRELRAQQV